MNMAVFQRAMPMRVVEKLVPMPMIDDVRIGIAFQHLHVLAMNLETAVDRSQTSGKPHAH
ncbi:MAG: hypothetical protein JJD98_02240 [Polaromonas sp.]|nr:hypothetical protein [Polaromonas sp.]